MQSINFTRSFAAINEAAALYNQDKPKRDQLRQGHIYLLQTIVKVTAAQNNKVKHITGELLPLSTNNGQLSTMLGVTRKTIYNYLERLAAAKHNGKPFIIKTWNRSSKSNYTIAINADLLSLHYTLQQVIAATGEAIEVKAIIENQKVTKEIRKSLPHTETVKHSNTVNSNVDNAAALSDLITVTGDEPPHKQKAAQLQSLNPYLFVQLYAMAADIWRYFADNVFIRLSYISPGQRLQGIAYLMYYFDLQKPNTWKLQRRQILIRAQIVSEWLQRDQARYIPIPAKYLNPDNKTGFTITEIWYKQMADNSQKLEQYKQAYQADQAAAKIYRQCVRQYLQAPNDLALFMQISNKLGRKSPELQQAFNQFINQNKAA